MVAPNNLSVHLTNGAFSYLLTPFLLIFFSPKFLERMPGFVGKAERGRSTFGGEASVNLGSAHCYVKCGELAIVCYSVPMVFTIT